jgi:thioredoxin 1
MPLAVVLAMTLVVNGFSAGSPPQAAVKAEIKTITSENWEQEVLNARGPVVVFFWATWSGPSKQQLPILQDVANDYAGKASVGKVEADANDLLLHRVGVSNIPTIRIYKGGQLVQSILGLVPKKALVAALNKHL